MSIKTVYKKVREVFSSFNPFNHTFGIYQRNYGHAGPQAARIASNAFSNYLINIVTNWFDPRTSEEYIFEEMYVHNAQSGASIDRYGTMVGKCPKHFYALRPDEIFIPGQSDTPNEKLMEEMVKHANYLFRIHEFEWLFETYGEMLPMLGQFVLHEDPTTLSLSVLRSDRITLIDDKQRVDGLIMDQKRRVIKEVNFVYIDEENKDTREYYPIEECYIVRLTNTPVKAIDRLSRETWGIYAVSPMQRALIPVASGMMINCYDMMWRAANYPRDHHKLSSEMYSLDKFVGAGDIYAQMLAANTAAEQDIKKYTDAINGKMPDSAYVTLDTTEIDPIEHSSAGYMQPNELLNQIEDQIWVSIGMPRSVVTGSSDNSYASEVLTSNYTADRVMQIAKRIKKPLLENVKKRLLRVNASYPVEYLELKLEFSLAATEIDNVRQGSIMGASGCVTYDEVRNKFGIPPLQKEQYDKLVRPNATVGTDGNYEDNVGKPNYPDTAGSSSSRSTANGESQANKSGQTKQNKFDSNSK